MEPQGGVGGLAVAVLALVVVTALALAFAALAGEDEKPARPAVVTIERARTQPPAPPGGPEDR